MLYAQAMIYAFSPFELDMAKFELRKDGEPCPIEPKVLALLAYLVEHRERLVSKEEIFEKLWDGRIVTDSALASRIKLARKVLGDTGHTQRFIKTVHGKGLRFVADVRPLRNSPIVSPEDDSRQEADTPQAADDVSYRPSIAVLPFQLLGKPGPYDTIADGLPHEIIAELARLRWLLVIARASSFRFRDRDPDQHHIGQLLGARYLLSGCVEASDRQLVITTELVDTRSGEIVWAERFTGKVEDIHAVRKEIREKILAALEIQIPLHEATAARLIVTENMDAWSAYHVGLQHIFRFNQKDNAAAAALFQRAIKLDPAFARAHAGLSFVHFQTAFLRHTDDIAGETALARRCAQAGLEIDPLDPFVNFTMGRSFWLSADLDRAHSWLERATSLCPNYAQGVYALAWTNTIAGADQEGRDQVDLAMRLSPLDPLYYAMLGTRGITHVARGEMAEAVQWAERAARSPGAHVLIAMIAAATQELAGNAAAAATWAANVRERSPQLGSAEFFGAFPMRKEPLRTQFATALQKLGF
ncbi:winged helix-turn-helix domain-containing tetratricopeptide repeat protein [Woeseia oceani]|nr:winged helix-turn-helix domain-containing protein [Woeseia oceani]